QQLLELRDSIAPLCRCKAVHCPSLVCHTSHVDEQLVQLIHSIAPLCRMMPLAAASHIPSHVDEQLLQLIDSIAPLCCPMTPEEVRRLGRGMRRLKPNAMARLLEIIEEPSRFLPSSLPFTPFHSLSFLCPTPCYRPVP
ncbi:unnamed protein product, partial [Closterium sp. NIES-65]